MLGQVTRIRRITELRRIIQSAHEFIKQILGSLNLQLTERISNGKV